MAQGSKTPPEVEERVWVTWQFTQSFLATSRQHDLPYQTVRGIVLRLGGGEENLAKVRQDIRAGMAEEAADLAMEQIRAAATHARQASSTAADAAHVADALARAGASAARVADVLMRGKDRGAPGPQKLEITFHGGVSWAPAPGTPPDGNDPENDGHQGDPPPPGPDPAP